MRVVCASLGDEWVFQARYHNTGLYIVEAFDPHTGALAHSWVLSSGLYLRLFSPAVEGQSNTLESAQRG